jgi:class 3 adenylate cyclase
VVDDLDSPTVDLTCNGPTTTIAIAYAARHPEKVRRLALQSPNLNPDGILADARRRIIGELAAVDWELFLECLALLNFGWTDVGRRVAEKHIKEANRAVWRRSMDGWRQHDVSPLIAQVKCPTLVLLRRTHRGGANLQVDIEQAGELAAALPNARLMRYDEDHSFLLASNWDSCLRLVEEFLAEGDEALPPSADVLAASTTQPQGMAVVLFTDIVDSTALTERLGDTVFRTASRALDEGMRAAMRESGGTPVDGKVLGDGVMGVFTSASQAIAAARRCIELSAESELQLHVGLHAGDVIHEKGNVYGGAVNIASRVCGLSAPGEVLVSGTVRELARTSAGVEFEDRGEQALKGIDDAVRLYEVRWQE